MSIRILHDGGWVHPGGASRLVVEMARALDAPVTVGHTECKEWWMDKDIEVDIAFNHQIHESTPSRIIDRPAFRPLSELQLGICFKSLEIDEDIAISSGTVAKWWIPECHQTHVHYCHVPPPRMYAQPESNIIKWGMQSACRMVDQDFAGYVDEYISNSVFTQKRVKKHYHSDSKIINPPIRTEDFTWREPSPERYVVYIGRLTDMKRSKLIAEAFEGSGTKLVMVGDGPNKKQCENRDNVVIYSGVSDWALEMLVSRSIGGIAFAEGEHCGMTPKEFQSAGKPVIVPDEPNLCNHVEHGVDGLVTDPTIKGIQEAVRELNRRDWDKGVIQQTADEWSVENFHKQIKKEISKHE